MCVFNKYLFATSHIFSGVHMGVGVLGPEHTPKPSTDGRHSPRKAMLPTDTHWTYFLLRQSLFALLQGNEKRKAC